MHDNGHPDIAGLHLRIAKEYGKPRAGEQLADDTLQPGIRAVIKHVDREMPESPHDAKQQHSCPLAESLLKHRLQESAPSVFLTEKGCEYKEEINGKGHHIYPYI